ncbi:MAG: response regulator [Spirochaetes bacterium]|nr:response regulator [Spirochaetota bacterium]
MKQKILIVDDTKENIYLLNNILQEYQVSAAKNGKQALKLVEQDPPDLILLDIMMPEMNGYEVCQYLKANQQTKNIPVLFVSTMDDIKDQTKGLSLGALDYITKPFHPAIVSARVKNYLELKQYQNHLEDLVEIRSKEVELTRDVTFYGLANLAETRDNETGGHIRRTQYFVKIMAEHPYFEKKLNSKAIEMIYKSAPLHDIGKVGVPDHILLKPTSLTSSEYELMQKHTFFGWNAIVKAEKSINQDEINIDFLKFIKEVTLTHHEKWDGTGYPHHLKGDEIPIAGRLMALADVYDALVSKRVYKPPLPQDEVIKIISEDKGKHFDPDIVDIFLELREQFRIISLKYADYDEEKQLLK